MTNSILRRLTAFTAALLCLGLTAKTILLQDFEDEAIFRPGLAEAVGAPEAPGGHWEGFNNRDFSIVPGASPKGGKQLMQLTRVGVAQLKGTGQGQFLNDRDTIVSVTMMPPASGEYCFGFRLLNTQQDKTVAQLQVNRGESLISVVDGHGASLGKLIPGQWQTIVVTFHPTAEKMETKLVLPDGTVRKFNDQKMQENLPCNAIYFYTSPNSPDPILFDEISIEQSDLRCAQNRENVALAAADTKAVVQDSNGEHEAPRLLDGDLSGESYAAVQGLPATVTVTLGEPRTISTVRLLSGIAKYLPFPSGDLSLTAVTIEGHSTASGTWRELASSDTGAPVAKSPDEEDSDRAWQFDFDPIEVRALRITLRDSDDTMKRSSGPVTKKEVLMREIEAYDHEFGGGDVVGLPSVLEAEWRVQCYRYQPTAHLHAILAEGTPPFEVEISFKERWNGTIPAAPFRHRIHPGLNIIPVDIMGWPNGEYRAGIRAAGKDAPVKGEFGRLLRIDRIPAAVPPKHLGEVSGMRLYFPDDWYLEQHQGLQFRMFTPDYNYLDFPRISGPDAYVKLGSMLYYTKDGRLVISFGEYSYSWKFLGRHYAACTPGKWDWKLTELPKDNEILLKNNAEMVPLQMAAHTGGSVPNSDGDNKKKFRLYDPAKDGPVNLKEVAVQYVGYKPHDWGVVKAPAQSTWLIWNKGGEHVLLWDHPFLQDGGEAPDGFEAPTATNDNHAGQWLSTDGKTLYFARGHLLRRFKPFIDRYDNLWRVSRIITIFSTQDGLHWDRHYLSLPDESDPPNLQHYGCAIYRAPRGGELMVGFLLPYDAHTQQYNVELVWSWNGEHWNRFPGHQRWIENGAPDQAGFGILHMHNYAIEHDGYIYHEIGWATPDPHFAGDDMDNDQFGGKLTGEDVRKTNEKRDVSTSWPFWGFYGSWDKLADSWNKVTPTTGVARYRKGGLFGAVAGSQGASFTSRPMRAKGKLTVNLRTAPGGHAKFTLLAPDGTAIATQTLDGDGVALPLFNTLPEGDFRIQAELQDAILYTLNFD